MELKDPFDVVPNRGGGAKSEADELPASAERTAWELVGKRVRIRAVRDVGSARFLDGLTGTVVAAHPIAFGWVKLDLDENPRTPHRNWSVAADRLVVLNTESSWFF